MSSKHGTMDAVIPMRRWTTLTPAEKHKHVTDAIAYLDANPTVSMRACCRNFNVAHNVISILRSGKRSLARAGTNGGPNTTLLTLANERHLLIKIASKKIGEMLYPGEGNACISG